jgi:hypothetical protein
MAVLQVSLGIGRYIEYLLSYWAGHLDSDEITVIVSEPIDLTSFGVTSVVIRPPFSNALWENFLLPRKTKNLDVMFGPAISFRFFPGPMGPRCPQRGGDPQRR